MINGDTQREEPGSDENPTARFELENDSNPPAGGTFVGVVVNRPIDQVLTYKAPGADCRERMPGPAPAGAARQGQPAGDRLLRKRRCNAAGGFRSAQAERSGRDPRPRSTDRREDARSDPLDGRILRLLVGPGA